MVTFSCLLMSILGFCRRWNGAVVEAILQSSRMVAAGYRKCNVEKASNSLDCTLCLFLQIPTKRCGTLLPYEMQMTYGCECLRPASPRGFDDNICWVVLRSAQVNRCGRWPQPNNAGRARPSSLLQSLKSQIGDDLGSQIKSSLCRFIFHRHGYAFSAQTPLRL